jgi:hypothetical protein
LFWREICIIPEKMKALRVIAWIGFGIFTLGTGLAIFTTVSYIVHPATPYFGGVDAGHPFAVIIALLGLPFMLAGGLIARPRLFWMLSVIMGCLYIIGFIPSIQNMAFYIKHTDTDYLMRNGRLFRIIWQNMMPVLPGIVCLGEGILIWRIEVRKSLKTKGSENWIQI